MYSFSTPGVKFKLIFAVQAAVFEIRGEFQNFHIWAWNVEFEEMSQSCICTLFLPSEGGNYAYFHSTGSHFRDTDQVSKFQYLAMKSGIWRQVESCICTFFLPHGVEVKLFSLYSHPFMRYGPIFKISIFVHEIWNLKKGPKVAYVFSFYSRGLKLSLFLLYAQPFSR